MSLQALKTLSVDRILEIEEAVALSAEARELEREYEELGIPQPDWLSRAAGTLREEIAKRTRAADLAELKRLEAELDSYKTVNERKTDAQKRLGEIQRKLGMAPAKAAGR
jgi:hypothetical protein